MPHLAPPTLTTAEQQAILRAWRRGYPRPVGSAGIGSGRVADPGSARADLDPGNSPR